jgi:hypothetical protein
MKKERFSFFILFVEIAAIVFLHTAKNKQTDNVKLIGERKSVASTVYQLKTFTLTKVR